MVKYMVVFVGRLDRMIYIYIFKQISNGQCSEIEKMIFDFFYVALFTKLGSITLKQSFTSK